MRSNFEQPLKAGQNADVLTESDDENGCICKYWLPRRYCVVLMLFFGLFNVYAMRVNLSVAIEPMSCMFNWNSSTEGLTLSAFFIGYLGGNIPGGMLAEKYGGKLVFGLGSLATAILTLILPFCTFGHLFNDNSLSCYCLNSEESSWCFNQGNFTNNDDVCSNVRSYYDGCNVKSYVWVLIVLRFFMGLFESVTFPAMYSLLNRWTAKAEKSKMIGISCAGMYFGTALGFPISSFIIASKSDIYGGWCNVFYFFSVIGILWWFLWLFTVYDSPFNDKHISKAEKEYLQKELPLAMTTGDKNHENVPWKTLLTHPVALIIYFTHFSHNWAFYTLMTELPTYLDDELDYNLSSAGFISIIPYLGQFFVSSVGSAAIDAMIERKIMSVEVARKLAQGVGTIIPGLLLIICGYINNATHIVILLSLATPLMGFVIPGVGSNYSDVSPTLSAVMYGIGNTICTLSGVISPLLCGLILRGHNKREDWKLIFYISFFIVALGTVLFWIFGTGKEVEKLNLKPSNKEQDITPCYNPIVNAAVNTTTQN